MPKGDRTRNRDLAAVALAGGKTAKEAAVAAGVSERTVFQWLTHEPFKLRVSELRGEMVSAALGRLSDGLCAAADALNELVKQQDADVKLKAAVKVIELALKVREQTDLADRLAAVERALEGGSNGVEQDATEARREGGGEADGEG
jgi:hypothetical protein